MFRGLGRVGRCQAGSLVGAPGPDVPRCAGTGEDTGAVNLVESEQSDTSQEGARTLQRWLAGRLPSEEEGHGLHACKRGFCSGELRSSFLAEPGERLRQHHRGSEGWLVGELIRRQLQPAL